MLIFLRKTKPKKKTNPLLGKGFFLENQQKKNKSIYQSLLEIFFLMNASYFAQQACLRDKRLRDVDEFPPFVDLLLASKLCIRVAPATIECTTLTEETMHTLQTMMHQRDGARANTTLWVQNS